MNAYEFLELVCTIESVSARILDLGEFSSEVVVESPRGSCKIMLSNGLCTLEYSGRIGSGVCSYGSYEDESLIQAVKDCL